MRKKKMHHPQSHAFMLLWRKENMEELDNFGREEMDTFPMALTNYFSTLNG